MLSYLGRQNWLEIKLDGVQQAVLMLKEYKPSYDALVDALERCEDLGTCIVAIENAATRESLGWFSKPLGTVFEELGSKFRRNSGSESFSGIFGSGIAGVIFLGIAFFWTF